ncbi:MAG: hypothetical protein J6Q53_03480 [Oscillospiraceae bacterium]|nr:hypothetical protein [Oscillospiraceae bacterium]
MRIKELFAVPDGEKVTEKVLTRVLLSSICGILLCMACLAGTTWAWFTVSIENTGNVIQLATVEKTVTITKKADKQDNQKIEPQNGSYLLENGTYTLNICLKSDATGPDDLAKQKGPVYVRMLATREDGSTQQHYFVFEGSAEEMKRTLEICSGPAVLSFSVIWTGSVSAPPVDNETVVI